MNTIGGRAGWEVDCLVHLAEFQSNENNKTVTVKNIYNTSFCTNSSIKIELVILI